MGQIVASLVVSLVAALTVITGVRDARWRSRHGGVPLADRLMPYRRQSVADEVEDWLGQQ